MALVPGHARDGSGGGVVAYGGIGSGDAELDADLAEVSVRYMLDVVPCIVSTPSKV